MLRFESPWMLAAAAVVPLAVVVYRRRRSPPARFSSLVLLPRISPSTRETLADLPFWMRCAALLLCALALARPQAGSREVREVERGIAIEMAIDRSVSMGSGLLLGNRSTTRFEAVKTMLTQFAIGNGGDLPGRPSDLVGIVAFAARPQTVCPLTLSRTALPGIIAGMRLADEEAEDGTAIGDAVAVAAARLQTAEASLPGPDGYRIRSKIIILLTDGENNAGTRSVAEATRLAAAWGVRVYAIAVQGPAQSPRRRNVLDFLYPRSAPDGEAFRNAQELRFLAESTGGAFRLVSGPDVLQSIYREIDRLEKSELPRLRLDRAYDLFPWLLFSASTLLALENLIGATWLRRTP